MARKVLIVQWDAPAVDLLLSAEGFNLDPQRIQQVGVLTEIHGNDIEEFVRIQEIFDAKGVNSWVSWRMEDYDGYDRGSRHCAP